MRVGQTSIIVFISKFLASILGFVGTVLFARILGAEVLGYYALVIALLGWLKMIGAMGVSTAVVKRISAEREPAKYFTAGAIMVGSLGFAIAVGVIIARGLVDRYVGVPVWPYVIVLLFSGLFLTFVRSSLTGERKVHISGLLTPTNITVSTITQIALVLGGSGLGGMLVGYIIGEIFVGVLGTFFLGVGLSKPSRRHFRSLFDYAKFSWFGQLKSQTFNNVDILVLGFFVPSSLVGIYSVAWSLAKFLELFGTAVENTMFPEISKADAEQDIEQISTYVNDMIAFGGLISIPGLFGGVILADRLMQMYGEEFTQGATVLGLLIASVLIYTYQKQFMGVLNAIDRPDLSFKINGLFIGTNLVLNFVLISEVGWVGAAIATLVSACIGLIAAFYTVQSLIPFSLPTGQIGRQFVSAGVMAAAVLASHEAIRTLDLFGRNLVILAVLVPLGAGTYGVVLMIISRRFRQVVSDNLPIEPPI